MYRNAEKQTNLRPKDLALKQILIVHGWMHSAARYERLRRDLEQSGDCRVTLYEFPGFGDTTGKYRRNILDNYTRDMKKYLETRKFDLIVAHSMGGNVVLKALEGTGDLPRDGEQKLILLSPVYGGVAGLKPLILFYPLTVMGIRLVQRPFVLCRLLIRLCSLLTIRRWRDVDERIIQDARRADGAVAAGTLSELTFDRWRLGEVRPRLRVLLVLGEKDRVISRRNMAVLKKDLGSCRVKILKGIGHTAVAEDYEKLLKIVKGEL